MMITPHFRRLSDRLASAPNRLFDVENVSGKPGRVRLRFARRTEAQIDASDATPLFGMLSTAARMAAHTITHDDEVEVDGFKIDIHEADYDELAEVRARILSGQDDVLIIEAVALDHEGEALAYGKGKLIRYADVDEDDLAFLGLDEDGDDEDDALHPISILTLTGFGLGRGSVLQTSQGILFLN